MKQKRIHIVVSLLILLSIGSYLLRQNHLRQQAYEQAEVYDYIPTTKSRIILNISDLSQADTILKKASLPQLSAILQIGLRIRQAAGCKTKSATLIISDRGESSVWFSSTPKETKAVQQLLPLLLGNPYSPVQERKEEITLSHYALLNNQFFHYLSTPAVMSFSLNGALFREILKNSYSPY